MFNEAEYSSDDNMAIWKLILANVCLGAIGVTSFFNGVISFSLTIIFAATIIKIYKLDPEPFILLSLHTIVSFLMLQDAPTFIAAITAVFVTCVTIGSMNVSFERTAVFLTSVAITSIQGKAAGAVAAILLVLAIIAVKLRPFRPAVNAVLVLLMIGTSVPISCYLTAVMSAIVVLLLSVGYIIMLRRGNGQLQSTTKELHLEHPGYNLHNNNDNNNRGLNLMDGRRVKCCHSTESLDLHGHTVTSALKTLLQVLKEHEESFRENQTDHTRYLRVITGEDNKNHAENNMNLVKPTVANFLKINKYRYQAIPNRPGILVIDLESHVK